MRRTHVQRLAVVGNLLCAMVQQTTGSSFIKTSFEMKGSISDLSVFLFSQD